MLTTGQLAAIFPSAEAGALEAFISPGLQALTAAGILDGANRLFYFLAQLGHESNGLTVREENLNYSASRLMQVWPSRFPTLDVAKKYENKPEQLANFVYGNRMGNVDDGDGYKYRGRGYIQLTGRDTYRAIGKVCGLDLEGNPDLASQVAYAPKIACAFWTWKNINPSCDTGDFTAVTQKINGGTNGLADRQAWLSKVQTVLGASAAATPKPAPALTPGANKAAALGLLQRHHRWDLQSTAANGADGVPAAGRAFADRPPRRRHHGRIERLASFPPPAAV